MAINLWDASLATGIPEIDEQHKKLISIIEELNQAMIERKGKETLGKILAGLRDYVQYHFRHEERLLSEHGYPKLQEQKAAHAGYEERLSGFEAKEAKGELGLSVHVLEFLMTWIKGHIKGEDMLYVPFLKGKGL